MKFVLFSIFVIAVVSNYMTADVYDANVTVNAQDTFGQFDGMRINADTIEYFLVYRKELLAMLLGVRIEEAEVQHTGVYPYGDQWHSIYTLAKGEQFLGERYVTGENNLTILLARLKLTEILTHIKTDVLQKSRKFFKYIQKHRSIFDTLCKRLYAENSEQHSIFKQINQMVHGQEEQLFQEEINSFEHLYYFCTALLQFLQDVIEHSPKARAQFSDRLAKWNKMKAVFIDLCFELTLESDFDEAAFFRHVKKHNLDLLFLGEITKEQVKVMLQEFIETAHYDL